MKDFYLVDTKVENIFINEFMPQAPGDYIKVYIYGLMHAQHGMSLSDKMFAQQLGLSEKKVQDAWGYWEKQGLVKRTFYSHNGDAGVNVEYISQKALMYGMSAEAVDEAPEGEHHENILGDEAVKTLLSHVEQVLGRSISSSELLRITGWVKDDGIAPEIVSFAFDYCVQKGKTSIKYIESVVKSWHSEGLDTVDKINEHLQDSDERFYRYKRILQALGFHRNATEAETKMMDHWFDDMGFSMDKVLEACGKTTGISNPNFSYVNKVLENWSESSEKTGADVNEEKVSMGLLNKYYEYLRQKADKEAGQRTEQVYKVIPRVRDIDNEIQSIGAKLSKALLMGEERSKGIPMRRKMETLQEERAVLLTENNFEIDFTDIKYKCSKCNDTGITDLGERCTCVPDRMKEAAAWGKNMK